MRFLKKFWIVMVVGSVLSAMLVSPASAAWTNDDPTRINVYDFNIHKMDDHWRNWIHWVDDKKIPQPDLLLVQDMQNLTERQQFQDKLGAVWGGTWRGRGGVEGGNGWHTAVIWRAARFENAKSRGWWGFGDPDDDATSECIDGDDGTASDVPNGAPAVQVRLYDKVAGRYVSAVSFKTPGASPDTCLWSNTRKVNWKLHEQGWSGGIVVMGTDANSRDWDYNADGSGQWRCWYRGTNGDIGGSGCGDTQNANQGFRDPIYQLCGGEPGCPEGAHDTHNTSRIDFIFAKLRDGTMPATSHQDTLDAGDANGQFSDHRAVRSMLYY